MNLFPESKEGNQLKKIYNLQLTYSLIFPSGSSCSSKVFNKVHKGCGRGYFSSITIGFLNISLPLIKF